MKLNHESAYLLACMALVAVSNPAHAAMATGYLYNATGLKFYIRMDAAPKNDIPFSLKSSAEDGAKNLYFFTSVGKTFTAFEKYTNNGELQPFVLQADTGAATKFRIEQMTSSPGEPTWPAVTVTATVVGNEIQFSAKEYSKEYSNAGTGAKAVPWKLEFDKTLSTDGKNKIEKVDTSRIKILPAN
jgi:hypothetical protein